MDHRTEYLRLTLAKREYGQVIYFSIADWHFPEKNWSDIPNILKSWRLIKSLDEYPSEYRFFDGPFAAIVDEVHGKFEPTFVEKYWDEATQADFNEIERSYALDRAEYERLFDPISSVRQVH